VADAPAGHARRLRHRDRTERECRRILCPRLRGGGTVDGERVRTDPALLRPAEVDVLQGDASKAERKLGWRPEVSLEQLAAEMVEADIARLSR
jgi:GDP-D-mannose dehydratase